MNTVKLTKSENVAYWWVKALKSTTLNIGKRNEEELEDAEKSFYDIFSCLESADWRYIYEELSQDVRCYLFANKSLFQNTQKGGHNKMNRFVTRIIGQEVPDISLCSKSSAIVVREGCVMESYDDDYKVLSCYHKENYVLTGQESAEKKTVVTA